MLISNDWNNRMSCKHAWKAVTYQDVFNAATFLWSAIYLKYEFSLSTFWSDLISRLSASWCSQNIADLYLLLVATMTFDSGTSFIGQVCDDVTIIAKQLWMLLSWQHKVEPLDIYSVTKQKHQSAVYQSGSLRDRKLCQWKNDKKSNLPHHDN